MSRSGRRWSESFGAAPQDAMAAYEDVLVPRLFIPWAELLADRLAIAEGERVLDVACGPGTVARVAARRVGTAGRVTAADISPAMLAIARSKPPVDGGAPIEYVESPAAPLAVPDASHDVLTCQQGFQFFPDRAASLAEMTRVLRPGGRAGIAVWNDIEDSPPFAALANGVEEVIGAEAAATYRDGPWGLRDPDELRGLLAAAGLAEVVVTRESLPFVLEGGAPQIVRSLLASALAPQVAALDDEQLGTLTVLVAEELEDQTVDGEIRSHAASNVAVARRP